MYLTKDIKCKSGDLIVTIVLHVDIKNIILQIHVGCLLHF